MEPSFASTASQWSAKDLINPSGVDVTDWLRFEKALGPRGHQLVPPKGRL